MVLDHKVEAKISKKMPIPVQKVESTKYVITTRV